MHDTRADIVVVGGGVAGFAAAVAAAAENKKVILLDKNPLLGGDSVNTNVGTICGAYVRSTTLPKIVGYDFSKSFLASLQVVCDFAKPAAYHQGLFIVPYDWEILQKLYADILLKNHVDVKLNTRLSHVHVQDKKITGLSLSDRHGVDIVCDAVIDCSGNAIVSQLAGLKTIRETSYQAAAQVFRISGVNSEDEFALTMAIKRAVLRKMEDLKWPSSYASLSVVPGSLRNNKADLKLTLPDVITDDVEKNIVIAREGRKRVKDLYNAIRNDVKSFQQSTLEMIFPQAGIRVLQRSSGEYVLTEHDILSCKKFDNTIAHGTWPIEEWDIDGNLKMEYFELNKSYSIPAGCLSSDQVDNLFFGGKNISATARAIASARVMGTGLQTGYAAGKIACAKNIEERNRIIASLHHELERF